MREVGLRWYLFVLREKECALFWGGDLDVGDELGVFWDWLLEKEREREMERYPGITDYY